MSLFIQEIQMRSTSIQRKANYELEKIYKIILKRCFNQGTDIDY
jgi:hypothetical protein